jgi:hypothetical protein
MSNLMTAFRKQTTVIRALGLLVANHSIGVDPGALEIRDDDSLDFASPIVVHQGTAAPGQGTFHRMLSFLGGEFRPHWAVNMSAENLRWLADHSAEFGIISSAVLRLRSEEAADRDFRTTLTQMERGFWTINFRPDVTKPCHECEIHGKTFVNSSDYGIVLWHNPPTNPYRRICANCRKTFRARTVNRTLDAQDLRQEVGCS